MRARIMVLFLWVMSTAHAGIAFLGIISGREGRLFALREHNGASIRWVAVGDLVNGFAVTSYDFESEELRLVRGAEVVALRLPLARVRDSGEALSDLEYAYVLALSGDEHIAGMIVALEYVVRRNLEFAAGSGTTEPATNEPTMIAIRRLRLETMTKSEGMLRARILQAAAAKRPNKAPEPTPTSVTSPAAQEPRQP